MKQESQNPAKRRGPSAIEIAAGVATSVLLHGLILGIAVVSVLLGSSVVQEESEYLEIVFDEVELLAFGEIRDPDQLPRLSASAPSAAEEVILEREVPEPAPADEVRPEEEPSVDLEVLRREREREAEEVRQEEERREEERRRAAEEREARREAALARHAQGGTGDQIPEGSPEGVVGGTVTDAALADMRATYQVRIRQELERLWEVPVTISSDELDRLAGQVQVSVRISERGHVLSYQFLSRSENVQFDESIERVLQRFQQDRGGRTLPMPEDPALRAEVLRGGMNLSNWKVTGIR